MKGPDRFAGGRVDDVERAHLAGALGARLRVARRAAGLTEAVLAERAGCSRSTIDRLERGERRPRTSLLDRLAAVLTDDEDQAAELAEELRAAAGLSLRQDTVAGLRRRHRRTTSTDRALAAQATQLDARLAQARARQASARPTRLPTVAELLAAGHPEYVERLRAERTAAGLDPDGAPAAPTGHQ